MAGTCIVNHDWMSDKNNELLLQTSLDGTLYRLKRSKIVPVRVRHISAATYLIRHFHPADFIIRFLNAV